MRQLTHLFTAISFLLLPGYIQAASSEQAHTYVPADDAVILLGLYVALALVASFLCSVAEAVLLSITPSYVAGLETRHPEQAAQLRRLRIDQVDRSLAAILTMNTIAHTVGAIGAGAQADVVFDSAAVGIFSAAMTLAILFLSEIIPKTLGATYWTRLVPVTTLFIRALVVVLYPLVIASEGLTRLIARNKDAHTVSRDELLAMAGIGARTGTIAPYESTFIRNLFRFSALTASDIMTPRTVIFALPESTTIAEAHEQIKNSPFSRIPVYGQDLDDITGMVLKDEILALAADDDVSQRLSMVKREIGVVPDTMTLPRLLDFLLKNRQHIAVAIGEYGDTQGLVTLEDVIETLLGLEIVDEMDNVPDMRALARQQWAQRVKALGLDVDEASDTGSPDLAQAPQDKHSS